MKTRHLSTTSNNVNDVNFMKRLFSALSFRKIKIQQTFGAVAMDTSSFALRIPWLLEKSVVFFCTDNSISGALTRNVRYYHKRKDFA